MQSVWSSQWLFGWSDLWNSEVYYCVDNNLSLHPIHSQMHPFHIFTPGFFKVCINIILSSLSRFPSGLFAIGFIVKLVYVSRLPFVLIPHPCYDIYQFNSFSFSAKLQSIGYYFHKHFMCILLQQKVTEGWEPFWKCYRDIMVRVISVHHFVSQDIHTCEDPVAAATAPPDYLLLALSQHVVEVRDLSKGGDVSFSFPTVDQAQQLLHCCTGNSCT